MAKFHMKYFTLVLLLCFFKITYGLYEDQIGKFDWRSSFVGQVKYANFDSKRIIVATEENVLACLNVKNGNILWRQILESEDEQQIQLLHVDKEILTVSGLGNTWYVRGWEITSGTLLWEWSIFLEKVTTEGQWSVVNEKLIYTVPVLGSHIEVTSYNIETGEAKEGTRRVAAPWVVDLSRCILTHFFFACISSDDCTGQIHYIDILSESNEVHSKSIEALIGSSLGTVEIVAISQEIPSVMLLRNNIARLILLKKEPEALPYQLLPTAISARSNNKNVIYQLEVNKGNLDKLLKVTGKNIVNGEVEVSVEIDYPKGLGAPHFVAAQCIANMCDLLLSSTDHALTLVRLPEGKILWSREEALSNIISVEFFELPVSELDASIENEFKTSSGDIFSMLIHRLATQAKQLSSLLFGSQLLSNSVLVRDDFGLHQIIVVATYVGKLFAIDTLTGSTVWSYRLPQVAPFENGDRGSMLLFVQRTARYAPLPAQCTLLAKDSLTGNAVMFQFDPITGLSKEGKINLNYKIQQAMLLPYEDENHLKPFIIVSNEGEVNVHPKEAKPAVQKQAPSIYLYTFSEGALQGFFLQSKDNQVKTSLAWKMDLGKAQLLGVSTRPSAERVHSQGRVLPDRSVYYKYVNPNLIALATLSDDVVHKHVVSVYLIDGITGLVLYSMSHKKAKGPVHIVHSENWLVYSFFNERFRRIEFVAAELYEGHLQSNTTSFSSHAVSQLPKVETQSYILPATPRTMTVTLTERGITSKCLLVAMNNGAVTEIPWALLQPRFADVACGPEESCYPYMPEIPLPPEATINYNQTLHETKGIAVAPAKLESTSHVLVYGLDLFYTRIAPSKTFDVLKEDFDHKLIVLVLAGLILASYITRNLASRKALRQAWK